MDTVIIIIASIIIIALVAAWAYSYQRIKTELVGKDAEIRNAKELLQSEKEQHEKAVAELKSQHENAVSELKNQHEKMLGALKEGQEKAIEAAKTALALENEKMLKAGQNEFAKKSNEDIEKILNPLKEKITELKEEMGKGNEAQVRLKSELEHHVQDMLKQSEAARKSADDLTNALKHGNKLQGGWGETILEELLDSQGLKRGVHFDAQYTIRNEKGEAVKSEEGEKKLIPDIVLHLGDDREVIIDSKVSLTAFIDYVNAETEDARKEALKEHIQSLRRHVRELAHKDYSSYIKPPKVSSGFVMMFVPNSGALWTALRAEPGLWREAAGLGVYIADEQSLYGALRIVDLTWRQIKQAESHQKVFELADEMLKRVGDYVVKYNALGDALNKAAKAYQEASIKIAPEGQSIRTSAEKLIRLGANGKQLISISSTKKEPLVKVLGIDASSALDTGLGNAPTPNSPSLPDAD